MLTARQAEAHRFIFEFTRRNGECPSYEEIRKGLGLRHKSGVVHTVRELEERGMIQRTPYRARSITLLRNPPLHHTEYFKWDDEALCLVPWEVA